LWENIVEDVKERFKYDLPSRDSLKSLIKSLQTVRSLCQKTGVQIEAKDYTLDSEAPFVGQNILSLVPVVKHSDPESMDGRGLLEVGKTFLNQGRLDIAYELLTEALAIFHQVYGPMHRDTANCYLYVLLIIMR
jgi:protein TIF31